MRPIWMVILLFLTQCASIPAAYTPPAMPPVLPESSQSRYYSPSAEEVQLEFEGVLPTFYGDAQIHLQDAKWEVERTLHYIVGPLQEAPVKAGPKYDGNVEILRWVPKPNGWYDIHYRYKGIFTMERHHRGRYSVIVPRQVSTLYERSQIPGQTDLQRNPCTHGLMTEEKYFWYFWNPRQAGCPLKQGIDYDIFQARITPTPNLVQARFPEYERLIVDNTLSIRVVFGSNEEPLGHHAPEGNPDINARYYQDAVRLLEQKGFTRRRWTHQEMQHHCAQPLSYRPTIDRFERKDGTHLVEVLVYWGSTNTEKANPGFACFMNEALQNASLFLYSAHSGLGHTMNLSLLRQSSGLPLLVNKDRYQIFSFNSCSSYGYYNAAFFRDKATVSDTDGTQNLDIITSGTTTSFEKIAMATVKELEIFLDWSEKGASPSYQEILRRIDRGTLTGVSGAHDNPRLPRTRSRER